ncbi:MAG: Sua5/YciO/YrdC/YwlC family protein [Propionibacterium sp.]|nr:Sua5/YciO/YrdC/YwlC family protein [Propionibacterium sp.]
MSGAQTNKTDQMGQGTSAASPQEGGSGEESFRRFDLATQRDEALRAAQAAVGAGQNIVLPTDTVYGIGADAFSADAVQGLLNAKHRGRDMPPPVLIAEPAMLPALVSSIPLGAERMIKECWPGALTLILNAATALHMDLGETAGTIAVRVPDNDDARALLLHTGPLAVSSANISGPSTWMVAGPRVRSRPPSLISRSAPPGASCVRASSASTSWRGFPPGWRTW